MSYNEKPLKRDSENIIVPQYWNPVTEEYEVLEGNSGAFKIQMKNKVIKEPFEGTSNITKTFSSPMTGFVISNDGLSEDLTFTINEDTYTVKKGEVFKGDFEEFTTVVIATNEPFRAYGMQ